MKRFFYKVSQILFCCLPVLITLGIQLAVTIPVTIYYFWYKGYKGELPALGSDFYQWMLHNMAHSDYAIYVTVVWGIISLTFFCLWYHRIHNRKEDIPVKRILTPYSVGGLALMIVGLQLSINYFYTLLEPLMPGAFKQYQEVLSFSDSTPLGYLILAIYGIFIAPIHEEFLNRGVTLHYAQKAMPFFWANILQAFLFGLLHMNLVQSSYAFLVGIVVGYIYHTAKNIWIPIIFHMAFNLFGTMVPLLSLKNASSSAYILVGVIGLTVAISGYILYSTSIKIQEGAV